MVRQISSERKTLYYVGGALIVIGFLSFFSTFLSAALNFGRFDNFDSLGRSMALCAFGGMFLIIVGAVVSNIGARGAAGSGLKLDPEQAREELEPFSRMTGGMLSDALDEADIHLGGGRSPEKVIMLKCRKCGFLNEEHSKFCQECGERM